MNKIDQVELMIEAVETDLSSVVDYGDEQTDNLHLSRSAANVLVVSFMMESKNVSGRCWMSGNREDNDPHIDCTTGKGSSTLEAANIVAWFL